MADLVENGKISKDSDGDGKYDKSGEYSVDVKTDMKADEIFVLKDANNKTHQIYEAMELKKVYEVASTDGKTKDTVVEIETLQFKDGNMELNPEKSEKTSFDLAKGGVSTVETHEGSNFGDKIKSGSNIDIMEGGKGADKFIFGNGTGADRITDFVVKNVDSDSDGKMTSESDIHADVIHILKKVNGSTIETAANVLSRVTSTSEGAVINLGGDGNTITLEGVNSSDLTAAHFVVVEV